MIKNCVFVFMYSTRYSCRIVMQVNFLNRFTKELMKIRPLGATLCRKDRGGGPNGRTNMTKLIVAFRNFSKAPTNKTKLCRKWEQCMPHFREKVILSANKNDLRSHPSNPSKIQGWFEEKRVRKKITALERDWTLATVVCVAGLILSASHPQQLEPMNQWIQCTWRKTTFGTQLPFQIIGKISRGG